MPVIGGENVYIDNIMITEADPLVVPSTGKPTMTFHSDRSGIGSATSAGMDPGGP